ncbi:MAG: 4-hydroxy-tetrahydrodipicolinate reductase, partial [Candidatus Gastranaerophilaceae bacterium]
MIKVAVCGSNGKMGQEVVRAVNNDNELELV